MPDQLLLCTGCGERLSRYYAYDTTCDDCRKDRLRERAGGSHMENQ